MDPENENAAGASGGENTHGSAPPSPLDMEWDWDGSPDEPENTAAADDEEPDQEARVEDPPAKDDPEPTETDEEPSTERKLRLRDGEEVSEGDLKKAYGARKDFEREKASWEAEKAQHEQQLAHVRQQGQFFAQTMPQVLATLQRNIPAQPDPSIAEADPIAYFVQKDKYESAVRELQQAQHAAQAYQQQQTKAQQEALARYTQAEHGKLMEAMPELRDAAKRRQFTEDLMETAKAYGLENDVNDTRDHRVILALADAMKWRQLQKQKPKAVEKAKEAPPVVQAPARRRSSAEVQAATTREQLSKLRRTGSAQDAEAFLSRFE